MKICQIGAGIIGKAWISHHLADKRDVVLWNRTAQPLLCYDPDLRKAAASADIIHVVVSDPPTVLGILEIIAPVLRSDQLVIQSSTIAPEWSEKNAALLKKTGVDYVEAPFTGSKLAAESRQVVFFIGGSEDGKKRALDVLQPLSKKIFDMGTNVKASALKLALNLNIAGLAQALSESLTLARQYGIADEKYFETLDFNVGHSGLSDLKKPKLMSGDFSPHFSVRHMHKDIVLAQKSSLAPLPQNERVIEIYEKGMAQGLTDKDFIALIQLLSKS